METAESRAWHAVPSLAGVTCAHGAPRRLPGGGVMLIMALTGRCGQLLLQRPLWDVGQEERLSAFVLAQTSSPTRPSNAIQSETHQTPHAVCSATLSSLPCAKTDRDGRTGAGLASPCLHPSLARGPVPAVPKKAAKQASAPEPSRMGGRRN